MAESRRWIGPTPTWRLRSWGVSDGCRATSLEANLSLATSGLSTQTIDPTGSWVPDSSDTNQSQLEYVR